MNLKKVAATIAMAAIVSVATVSFAAADKKDAKALEQAVAGEWRTAEAKARDVYRHPVESLQFWGLKPGMAILEIQPGWWTEILAPYARMTGGEFYATGEDLEDPGLSEGDRKSRSDFEAKYSDAAKFGKVNVVNWGSKAAPLPSNKFDFVLLGRVYHGWMRGGVVEKNLANLFASMKPGAVLAIEQHRAPATQDASVFNGYVPEATVIEQVEKAGFKLDGKSEINANPKDTKDHPFGVWTLPPSRRSSQGGKPVDPSFDRAKYDAIGESDRMTLRFVKPKK